MKISAAIEYLNDESIDIKDRFKTVSGFDSDKNERDSDPERKARYWLKALKETLTNIEEAKATSSVVSFFTSAVSFVTGDNLKDKLADAYTKGSARSDERINGQKEYINIVVSYLNDNKKEPSLLNFELTDPDELLNNSQNKLAH